MDAQMLAHIIDSRTLRGLAQSALPEASVIPSAPGRRVRLERSRVTAAGLLRRYADALAPSEAVSPVPPTR